jgi:hypothetical protein
MSLSARTSSVVDVAAGSLKSMSAAQVCRDEAAMVSFFVAKMEGRERVASPQLHCSRSLPRDNGPYFAHHGSGRSVSEVSEVWKGKRRQIEVGAICDQ